MLSLNEIENIFEVIDRQTTIFIGMNLGKKFLSDKDKKSLVKFGIDVDKLYKLSNDPIFLNYQLGLISSVIGENNAKKLTYTKLKHIIDSGQYIVLNEREKAVLDSVKRQSMSDIVAVRGKIFQDFNQVVNNVETDLKTSQEEFVREEIMSGLEKRKMIPEITRGLNKKTGDWSRDFSKMVQYISHKALSEGRAAMIRRVSGEDAKVYMHVYPGACSHCIRLYLTNGIGSAPKVFKLSEIEANGTNIGRKVDDWLPVVPGLHPFCRCHVFEFSGGEWDGSKFVLTEGYKTKLDRKKIRVNIGGVDYMV